MVGPINWGMTLVGLTEVERREIEALLRLKEFPRGSLIYQEGLRGQSLFVVHSGRVKAGFVNASGREQTKRIFGRGQVLGLVTILTDTAPVLSVEAVDGVKLLAISKQDFMLSMERHPKFAVNVAKLVAGMAGEWLAVQKSTGDSAPIRLGKALCELASVNGRSQVPGPIVVQGITHQELASLVGASRPWVSLMLGRYERDGVLHCRRSNIRINDLPTLHRYVEEMEWAE